MLKAEGHLSKLVCVCVFSFELECPARRRPKQCIFQSVPSDAETQHLTCGKAVLFPKDKTLWLLCCCFSIVVSQQVWIEIKT